MYDTRSPTVKKDETMFNRPKKSSRSLSWYIFDYSTLLIVPVLLIVGFIGYTYISSEKTHLLDLATRWSIDASAGIDAEITSDISAANVLASSPDIRAGNLEGFYHRTKMLQLPAGSWLSVRDKNGAVLMSTALDHYGPTGAYYHNSRIDRAVFEYGQDVVSDVRMGTTIKEWLVVVATPVFDKDDRILYCLQYVVPARHFLKLLQDTNIPQGWFMTLVDNNYNIVARTADNEKYTGQPANPLFFDMIHNLALGGSETWDDKTSFEGNRIIGAVHKMTSTGWTVGVAAESSVYGQPLWYSLVAGAVLLMLSGGLSTLVSKMFARRMSVALSTIKQRGIDMRDDHALSRDRTGVLEFDETLDILGQADGARVSDRKELKATQKELHHRVKNSLQSIASMLRIQRSHTEDDTTKMALDTAALRISSVGRVHQGLYSTDKLVFNSKNLINVVDDIKEKMSIDVCCDIVEVDLDLDLGQPLALMLTEAVTNAFRYGHAGNTTKVKIDIHFVIEGDDHWRLTIRDYGAGFSETPNRRGNTLGLKFMGALEKQIGGVLTFTNHPDGGGLVTMTGPMHIERVA